MWLLSTARRELHYFPSPEAVPKGYAILSHVWGVNEQTFEMTPKYDPKRPQSRGDSQYQMTKKIRMFCKLAASHGYDWAWADTCCIDKSSSAELSEAINSMYNYYRCAERCYAYLVDVSVRDWKQMFTESRWHKRGWTLQELIAPDVVVFVDKAWKPFGTKAGIADLVQKATAVPMNILLLETPLTDISVAQRMSWASERHTTRVEDQAYCLMGIFGINMPTLYGEGLAAFRRLQEEIMKNSTDSSLFLWGMLTPYFQVSSDICHSRDSCDDHPTYSNLLAPAPCDFRAGVTTASIIRRVHHTPNLPPDLKLEPDLPTFTVTPYGILSRVPVIRTSSGITAALLFCTFSSDELPNRPEVHLALLLAECRIARTPRGASYDIGILVTSRSRDGNTVASGYRAFTIQTAELATLAKSRGTTIKWEKIYLANRPIQSSHTSDPHILINRTLSEPFQIPRWLIRDNHLEPLPSTTQLPWSGESAAAFLLPISTSGFEFTYVLSFGLCKGTAGVYSTAAGVHWANISPKAGSDGQALATHDCARDHVRDWPGYAKIFRHNRTALDGAVLVRIAFTEFPHWQRLPQRVLTLSGIQNASVVPRSRWLESSSHVRAARLEYGIAKTMAAWQPELQYLVERRREGECPEGAKVAHIATIYESPG